MVRTRFAPSPTGMFHIGGARTALFNWLFAKKHGGVFYLRIEDTDQSRFNKDAANYIFSGLKWLGINWQEGPDTQDLIHIAGRLEYNTGGAYGPYIQSRRLDIYKEYVNHLIEADLAYPCFNEGEKRIDPTDVSSRNFKDISRELKLNHWRTANRILVKRMLDTNMPYHVRLKMPRSGRITVIDKLRGKFTFPYYKLKDPVIWKTDGHPTYHLASVVDDHLMKTTHVLRGEEWLSSLPLHWQLYEFFGWEKPVFVHLPVILSPKGKGKMSKRRDVSQEGKEVAVFVHEYKDLGYPPEALVNFMALVGWSPGNNKEIMAIDELINAFDLNNIGVRGSKWDIKKLNWMSQEYIKNMKVSRFIELAKEFI